MAPAQVPAWSAEDLGNGNGGHAFGSDLAAADKRDLLEFLKTK